MTELINRQQWLSLILILVTGCILYANTLHSPFYFDDLRDIVENPAIRSLSNIKAWCNYAPSREFAMFTFALNYRLHQYNVIGYHVFNITVHIISAILVWWLIKLILSTPVMKDEPISAHRHWLALIAGLLFVAHPLQTQAVTYIVQRMASMATMFYLLSLALYATARMRNGNKKFRFLLFTGAFVAALLGMLTKQIVFTLPFAIILFEILFLNIHRRRFNFRNKYFIGGIIIFVALLILIPALWSFDFSIIFRTIPPQQGHLYTLTGTDYLCTQFRVILTYIRLLIFPVHQNVDYDYPLSVSLFEPRTMLSLLILLTILIYGLYSIRKNRLRAFGIFWFFLTLSVESSIIPIPNVIFEHRLYLPSFGFFIAFIALGYPLLRHQKSTVSAAVCLMIVLTFSVLTIKRNNIWQDDLRLWNDVVKKSPNKARPYINRGKAFFDRKHYRQALDDFNRALTLNPAYATALFNRGLVYLELNQYENAIADFNTLILDNPQHEKAFNYRGAVYLKLKKPEAALNDMHRSIDINPRYSAAFYNRSKIYFAINDYHRAIADLKRVIELDARHSEAHVSLGIAYKLVGDFKNADMHFNRALQIDPENPHLLLSRGAFYMHIDDYRRALTDFNHALRIDSTFVLAYFQRALAFTNVGEYETAITDLNYVISSEPNYADAYINRGLNYAHLNQWEKSLGDYNYAIELDSGIATAYLNRAIAYFNIREYEHSQQDVTKAQQLGAAVYPQLIKKLKHVHEGN